jgi:glycosyltransferase involved in cell wall biosynthesis
LVIIRRSFVKIHHKVDHRNWIPDDLELTSVVSGELKKGSVTIVMAAYMRSNVMKIAIESVLSQTFTEWNLIIVGDATDSNSKVVADSFCDERIRFINLSRNFGDQSMPNSIGAQLCATEYLAFLSQDDIWYPDHLSQAISFLAKTKSDFYLASFLRIKPSKNNEGSFAADNRYVTGNVMYSPVHDWEFVASTWVLRSDLARKIGDWRSAREVRYAASQEYLFRCWASGARILIAPHAPSVLIVPSIHVENSYSSNSSMVHRNLLNRILGGVPFSKPYSIENCNSSLPSKIRAIHLGWQAAGRGSFLTRQWVKSVFFAFHTTVHLVSHLGISPWEYAAALLGVKKGFHKNLLDEQRGL